MTRSALDLFLDQDSFSFDTHDAGGRSQGDIGLDIATGHAEGGAAGFGIASTAPGGAPGHDLLDNQDLAFTDLFASAKGGGGGGGGPKNGGDPGGTGGTTTTLMSEYTSGGASATSYNVQVVFKSGEWTESLQSAFIKAADYLSTVITGDIPDVFFRGKVIDDISIDASVVTIDGSGGILGQAGPTAYRTADYLPAAAKMEFDVADAQWFDGKGLFDDIVLHEMLHSIGFGTMWDLMGLTTGSIAGGDLAFTGDNAVAAYNALFLNTATGVPIETDGGPGTAGGHWDEAQFANEIMTGYIGQEDDPFHPNSISSMTIAALEDMGYQTLFDAADPTGTQFLGTLVDPGYITDAPMA